MITLKQFQALEEAYSYFNKHLFEGKLPDAMLLLHRLTRSKGYLHFERLKERDTSVSITELALNPDAFFGEDDMDALATLVHEMVHLLRFTVDGEEASKYHSLGWASRMKEIGLYPSSTGEPGGKETGQRMSHYIIPGGKFEITAGAFLANGKKIFVESPPIPKEEKEKKKTRWKFTCPDQHLSAWAKKDANLVCGECGKKMVSEDE